MVKGQCMLEVKINDKKHNNTAWKKFLIERNSKLKGIMKFRCAKIMVTEITCC